MSVKDTTMPTSFYDITATNIDGENVHFDEEFRGRVVLITNVASEVSKSFIFTLKRSFFRNDDVCIRSADAQKVITQRWWHFITSILIWVSRLWHFLRTSLGARCDLINFMHPSHLVSIYLKRKKHGNFHRTSCY